MTFTGTERLVRKIVDALRSPAGQNPTGVAQEYAETCKTVQMRLEQCGALLNEGNELQAVQLAEVQPPLLDLIRLLGFREAPQWSAYCQQNKLPIAVTFDGKIISRLNQAYSKGITPDHPLIKDYREAVLRRQDVPAMNALRSILRLNSSDKNAQGELERLEKKLTGQKVQELTSALTSESKESIANRVDEIEALNFKTKPSGEVYEEAQRIRKDFLREVALSDAQGILAQIEPLMAGNQWRSAQPMIRHVAYLENEHQFQFLLEEAIKWSRVQGWLNAQENQSAKDHQFEQACQSLSQALEQSEDRQAAQRQMTMSQLRADLEVLVKRHRAVTEFGMKLPQELELRFRKRSSILKAQIAKGQKGRLTIISAGCTLAVTACLVAGYVVYNQQESNSLIAEMGKLRSARQVLAAETFVKDLKTNSGRYLAVPQVNAAEAETASFIKGEEDRRAKFDEFLNTLDSLSANQFKDTSAEDIQKRFADGQQMGKQLAPDFQANANSRLLAFQNKWEDYLTTAHDSTSQDFAAKLSTLEQAAQTELDYNRKPKDLALDVDNLTAGIAKLAPRTTTDIPQLKLGDDLLGRFSDLQNKVTPFQAALKAYNQSMADAQKASSLNDYLQVLQKLSANAISGAPSVNAAKQVANLGPTADKLLQGLLMPNDPDGWAFFNSNPDAPFYPTSDVLDPEKQIYDQVVTDPNTHSIFRYSVDPVNTPDASTEQILTQGEIGDSVDGHNLTTKDLTDYNPQKSPEKLIFVQERLSGYFLALGETSDSQAFRNSKFSTLIDDSGSKFVGGPDNAPIDDMFDEVAHDAKATSLFKAFLLINAGKIIEAGKRSNFWGLQYSPSIKQALAEMTQMEPVTSGDWMVPKVVQSKQKIWDALFATLGKISFYKQACTLRAIDQRVSKTGFDYVGFVDVNGNASIPVDHDPIKQLWGWDSSKLEPTLLFTYSDADHKYHAQASTNPMVMSPLFFFPGDAQAILTVVRQDQNLSDNNFRSSVAPYLPPFLKLQNAAPVADAAKP